MSSSVLPKLWTTSSNISESSFSVLKIGWIFQYKNFYEESSTKVLFIFHCSKIWQNKSAGYHFFNKWLPALFFCQFLLQRKMKSTLVYYHTSTHKGNYVDTICFVSTRNVKGQITTLKSSLGVEFVVPFPSRSRSCALALKLSTF